MNKTKATIGIMAVVLMLALIGLAQFNMPSEQNVNTAVPVEEQVRVNPTLSAVQQPQDDLTKLGVHYKGHVRVTKTEAKTGITTTVADDDNLLTTIGGQFIRTQMTGGNASNVTKYIGLTNSAAGVNAADIILPSEITTNGLDRNTTGCTIANNGTLGYDCEAIFVATASQSAQMTGLYWTGVDNQASSLLAELTFTQQNLLVNDILTVKWTVTIS